MRNSIKPAFRRLCALLLSECIVLSTMPSPAGAADDSRSTYMKIA